MSQTYAPTQSQQYRQSTGGQTTGQTGGGSVQQFGGGGRTGGGRTGGGRTGGGQTGFGGPVGQRFATASDLPEDVRTSSIGILNECLANITTVTMQLKDAHWNVKGIHFYQLHELFEDLIDELEPHIDEIAERASALGGQPLGTARDVVRYTSIPPVRRDAFDGQSMLEDLAERLSLLDASLHRGIKETDRQNDLDTADLLNEVSRDVSTALWFVEAHIQGGAPAPAGQETGMTQGTGGMQGIRTMQETGEMQGIGTSPQSDGTATGTGSAGDGTAGFQSSTFGGASPDSQRGTGGRH